MDYYMRRTGRVKCLIIHCLSAVYPVIIYNAYSGHTKDKDDSLLCPAQLPR